MPLDVAVKCEIEKGNGRRRVPQEEEQRRIDVRMEMKQGMKGEKSMKGGRDSD